MHGSSKCWVEWGLVCFKGTRERLAVCSCESLWSLTILKGNELLNLLIIFLLDCIVVTYGSFMMTETRTHIRYQTRNKKRRVGNASLCKDCCCPLFLTTNFKLKKEG